MHDIILILIRHDNYWPEKPIDVLKFFLSPVSSDSNRFFCASSKTTLYMLVFSVSCTKWTLHICVKGWGWIVYVYAYVRENESYFFTLLS